ncbi:MAG: VWA domain-containing protein, partial [Thermoanaerobaculia bacterium]
LPFVPAVRGDLLLAGREEGPEGQEGRDQVEVIVQDGQLIDRTTVGIDPAKLLRRLRREKEPQARPVLLDPMTPLGLLAGSTGGELVTGQLQLKDLLERLLQRRRLVYRRESSGQAGWRRLEVVAALSEGAPERLTVRAPGWASSVTPEVVAAVRARRFFADEIDEGDLPIAAAVQPLERPGSSRLVVQLDAPTPTRPGLSLRLTVGAADADDRLRVTHELRTPGSILSEEEFGVETLTLELELAGEPEGPVVVLVEDLATGRWGAAFASAVASGGALAAADDAWALLLPAPRVIHLMSPRGAFAMGRTTLETVVSASRVARVDFLLDGELQAAVSVPPFSATLDLGPLPQPRRVEAVAYDPGGNELGRDYLILNEGSGNFGVWIVEPQLDRLGSGSRPLIGPVDVEAEVEPRRGEGIDRVEFFWKETLVATRFARPYRQRVVIPADSPKGFIRVVAYLEDGASSEDVVFVNSPGSSERLQVNLMEFYVVVSDRRGRPVKGLRKEDFRLSEAGEPQEIATFSDAGDLPLTVGLAIDSSASMFVKLPQVQFAAAEFIRGLSTRRDRAFVVGFGDEPRLARNTTSDLPRVIHALGGLQPDGRTAIWKAIVYSLVQLQGVPGKKALIVYSDGADEDPDFSFRTCLRFARKVGVPIYLIVSNNEIVRTEGRGLNVRSFLGRLQTLVDSVGGRLFLARVGEDLKAVYRQIEEELRSQYLLGYYSASRGGREWQPIKVEVHRSGLKARTIAGYFR